jgi:hypothetical protein
LLSRQWLPEATKKPPKACSRAENRPRLRQQRRVKNISLPTMKKKGDSALYIYIEKCLPS